MCERQNDKLILQCEHSTKVASISRHHHTKYEVIFVVDGAIRVEVTGTTYIANSNQLVFLSALEEHSVEILSAHYERYFLILDNSALDQLIKDPVLYSIFKNRPKGFSHVCDAPAKTADFMQHIVDEYSVNDQFSEEIIGHCLKQILVNLYRNSKQNFPVANTQAKTEIYAIQKYIDQNFRENIKIAELADRFFISSYYLSHSFKAVTGYSPKHYWLLARLAYSKALLLETSDSIESIALKSGFLDANSFIRSFKNEFLMTPNKYRKIK